MGLWARRGADNPFMQKRLWCKNLLSRLASSHLLKPANQSLAHPDMRFGDALSSVLLVPEVSKHQWVLSE